MFKYNILCRFTYEAAGEEMPCGRSWHTFSAVSDTMIFLYGGFSQDETPLSKSCWNSLEETEEIFLHVMFY